MKITEALRYIKRQTRVLERNKERIGLWGSHLDTVDPSYDIKTLIQSSRDIVLSISRIKVQLHKTNLQSIKELDLGEEFYKRFDRLKHIKPDKSIDFLITARSYGLPQIIDTLNKQRRYEKTHYDPKDAKVVTHYDPKERDQTIDGLENDMEVIDAILDEINTKVDLLN